MKTFVMALCTLSLLLIGWHVAKIDYKMNRPIHVTVTTGHADAAPPSVPHFELASCTTHGCWDRVRAARRWRKCVTAYGRRECVFRGRFAKQPRAWRDYAVAVFACEGGKMSASNWDIDGSGFFFRGEWTLRTAQAAGLARAGRTPTYHEEALAVIAWTKIVGFHSTRGWPHCPR